MALRSIENFKMQIGDIAMNYAKRNGMRVIEVVLVESPDLRCYLTEDCTAVISSNIPRNRLPCIIEKAKRNAKLLEL